MYLVPIATSKEIRIANLKNRSAVQSDGNHVQRIDGRVLGSLGALLSLTEIDSNPLVVMDFVELSVSFTYHDSTMFDLLVKFVAKEFKHAGAPRPTKIAFIYCFPNLLAISFAISVY